MAKHREVRVRGVKDDLDVFRRFSDSKVALWSISAKFGLMVDFAVLDKVDFGFLPRRACGAQESHGRPVVVIVSGHLRIEMLLRSTGALIPRSTGPKADPNQPLCTQQPSTEPSFSHTVDRPGRATVDRPPASAELAEQCCTI